MTTPTTYNFTIDDTSPQISYIPAVESVPGADPEVGWELAFNGSDNTFPGQQGQGESMHVTSKDGATLSIAFTGTDIELWGQTVQSSISVAIDNMTEMTSKNPLTSDASVDSSIRSLAAISGLSQSDHVITLTAHTSVTDTNTPSVVIFDRAVVNVSTGIVNGTIATEFDSSSEMQFTGMWSFFSEPNTGDYHISNLEGDQALYQFQGTSVQLEGLMNATAGLYNVSITSNSVSVIQSEPLSGLSSFLANCTLFYASGLDPSASHTLTVTNMENKTLALNGVQVNTVKGGQPSSSGALDLESDNSLSSGSIAAIVVGAVFCLFLIASAVLIACWYRRRRSRIVRVQRMETPSRYDSPPIVDIRREMTFGGLDAASFTVSRKPPSAHNHLFSGSFDEPFEPTSLMHPAHIEGRATSPELFQWPSSTLARKHHRESRHHRQGADDDSWAQHLPFIIDLPSDEKMDLWESQSPPAPSRHRTTRPTREPMSSFLDFASSAASSIRSRSSHTRSSRRSNQLSGSFSGRSNRSQRQDRRSRTPSSPLSLALSVDPGSGTPSLRLNTAQLSPRHPFFTGAYGNIDESPTDSIPLTVSDLAFRTDDSVDGDDRRISGSHLPPHPPLPSTRGPHIAQLVFGRRAAEARVDQQEPAANPTPGPNTPSEASGSITPRRSRGRLPGFIHFGKAI